MRSEEDFQSFKFEKDINKTDDILEIRNTFQEKAKLLGFKKPELTVMITASAEVYRLFFNNLHNVNVKITRVSKDHQNGIAVDISGNIKRNSEEDNPPNIDEMKQQLDTKLEKVKTIFPHFELACNQAEKITLAVKKWVSISDIRPLDKRT